MAGAEVHLISRWPLKRGLSDELADALASLALAVRDHEPGTLSYEAYVGAFDIAIPPSTGGMAGRLPADQQRAVIFEETYADVAAFARHVEGDVFNEFRTSYIHHFYEDPNNAGWPAATVTFLSQLAAMRRHDA